MPVQHVLELRAHSLLGGRWRGHREGQRGAARGYWRVCVLPAAFTATKDMTSMNSIQRGQYSRVSHQYSRVSYADME